MKIAEVDPSDKGARPKAVESLRKATGANPWQPRFALSLSGALSGQDDKARPLWEKVDSLGPNDNAARQALGLSVTPTVESTVSAPPATTPAATSTAPVTTLPPG